MPFQTIPQRLDARRAEARARAIRARVLRAAHTAGALLAVAAISLVLGHVATTFIARAAADAVARDFR